MRPTSAHAIGARSRSCCAPVSLHGWPLQGHCFHADGQGHGEVGVQPLRKRFCNFSGAWGFARGSTERASRRQGVVQRQGKTLQRRRLDHMTSRPYAMCHRLPCVCPLPPPSQTRQKLPRACHTSYVAACAAESVSTVSHMPASTAARAMLFSRAPQRRLLSPQGTAMASAAAAASGVQQEGQKDDRTPLNGPAAEALGRAWPGRRSRQSL